MWRDAAVAVPADCALRPHLQAGVYNILYRQVRINSILKFDTIIILFYNKISNVGGQEHGVYIIESCQRK